MFLVFRGYRHDTPTGVGVVQLGVEWRTKMLIDA